LRCPGRVGNGVHGRGIAALCRQTPGDDSPSDSQTD